MDVIRFLIDFILHIDMMFKDPTIELDGKVFFDHGEVVFD